jgi:hypothetical protein
MKTHVLMAVVCTELFEKLADGGREFETEVMQVIRLGYKDRESVKQFHYSRPRLVHNQQLLDDVCTCLWPDFMGTGIRGMKRDGCRVP